MTEGIIRNSQALGALESKDSSSLIEAFEEIADLIEELNVAFVDRHHSQARLGGYRHTTEGDRLCS
jgi:hypothetical protein